MAHPTIIQAVERHIELVRVGQKKHPSKVLGHEPKCGGLDAWEPVFGAWHAFAAPPSLTPSADLERRSRARKDGLMSDDPRINELNSIFENMTIAFTRQREMNRMLMDALIEVDEEILKPLETAGLDDLPILRAAATKLDVRLQEIIDDPMWNV